MTVGQEQTGTVRQEDTLFHGETLLVVAASYAKDVTSEFVTDRVCWDLLGHFLVEKDTVAFLLIQIDEFLSPSGGVGDVDLHIVLLKLGTRPPTFTDDEPRIREI